MNSYSLVDCFNYPRKSWYLQFADCSLLPLRVACNAHHVTINEQGEKSESEIKTEQVGLRIIAALTVFFTFPVSLIALAIKWLRKEEWQGVKCVDPSKINVIEIDDEIEEDHPDIPEEHEEFVLFLENELALAQGLDQKLDAPLPNSWREYGKNHGEIDQTFASYIKMEENSNWPDQRPLHIQRIGTFSETDLKIISITTDYLHIFHNIPIHFTSTIMKMDQLKDQYLKVIKKEFEQLCETEEGDRIENQKIWFEYWQERMDSSFPRKNGQYDAEAALECIETTLLPSLKDDVDHDPQMIAFTSEDLFTSSLTNFVFGCASLMSGAGIWSNARFGNAEASPEDFQKCLLRMMKISAHEFGHMRGLTHCTDYDCNIGGYMSLKELDSRPLLYCLQDTAKICYLTHTSMLAQHKRILDFFKNFNQTYQLNCDFSKEIEILNKRISV